MDDIGIAQAILMFLLIYGGLNILLTGLGSFGFYKFLAAKNNPAASWIAAGAFILILVAAFFGAFQFGSFFLVAELCWAVFGITAWVMTKPSTR